MILDSYAVLALLRDEAAAPAVEQLLTGRHEVSLTAVGVAEVMDRLVRLSHAHPDEAALDLAQLGLSEPIPLEPGVARRAGLLRAAHYHRRTRAVSLADCVAAETARTTSQELVTSDPHLLEMCMAEAVDVIALPDTGGDVWTPT